MATNGAQPFKPEGGNPSHDLTRESLHAGSTDEIVSSIKRAVGHEGSLDDQLSSLSGSQLNSLLIKVFDEIAAKRKPEDILREYTGNVLTNAASVDPRELLALESHFYNVIPRHFEPVELGILHPLGANRVISGVSQKTAFSATRNVEVMADITVGLGLEAAMRRRAFMRKRELLKEPISLAASQRIARIRERPSQPGYNAHWKVVALASAGINNKWRDQDFESSALLDHARVYLQLFERAARLKGLKIEFADVSIMRELIEQKGLDRRKVLHDANHGKPTGFSSLGVDLPGQIERLSEDVAKELAALGLQKQVLRLGGLNGVLDLLKEEFPDVNIGLNLERTAGAGYYRNLCFHVKAVNEDEEQLTMVDGGNSDWTQKMLASRKETIIVSGMGSELFIRKFGFMPEQ